MIPEIDTQLAAIMKSLADNVLPAVDAGNPMAGEQIQLCLATLGLVRSRLPLLHRYLRRELRDNLALARAIGEALPEACPALSAAVSDGECVMADADCGASEIEAQTRALKAQIASAVSRSRGSAQESAVRDLVLEAQGPMILRNRAWTLGMGFEPDPAQVPDVQTLLRD